MESLQLLLVHLTCLDSFLIKLEESGSPSNQAIRELPDFFYSAKFPCLEHFNRRIQFLKQAVKSEMEHLIEAFPYLLAYSIDSEDCIQEYVRNLMGLESLTLARTEPPAIQIKLPADSNLINIMIPDQPVQLLELLLRKFPKQLIGDAHLPLNIKCKSLLDRVCQYWRLSPVSKETVIAQWVLELLQNQDEKTLWECLSVRLDKLELTTRREFDSISSNEIEMLHHLTSTTIQHTLSYVAQATIEVIEDLPFIFMAFKHIDSICDLLGFPKSGSIPESLALGCMDQLKSCFSSSKVDQKQFSIGDLIVASQRMQQYCIRLQVAEVYRHGVVYCILRQFLQFLSQISYPLIGNNTRQALQESCFLYSILDSLETRLSEAESYFQGDQCQERYQNAGIVTSSSYIRSIVLSKLQSRNHMTSICDDWIKLLEDEFVDEIEGQLDELLHVGLNSDFSSSTPPVDLFHVFLEEIQKINQIKFPRRHHAVRIWKALARLVALSVMKYIQWTLKKHSDVPRKGGENLDHEQLCHQIHRLLNLGIHIEKIHNELALLISKFDLNGYKNRYKNEEVMTKITIYKPVSLKVEFRVEGDLLSIVKFDKSQGEFLIPLQSEQLVHIVYQKSGVARSNELAIILNHQQLDSKEPLRFSCGSDYEVTLDLSRSEELYAFTYFKGCSIHLENAVTCVVESFADRV
jgi:hypothetical protein